MAIKAKLSYIWAASGIPVMLVLIFGANFWMDLLFLKPGVVYSERISGGEVQAVADHQSYKTLIHKPVFEGFFGDTKDGFIQIDWKTENSFPDIITESVDYDNDGRKEFKLELDTVRNTIRLIPYISMVKDVSGEKVMVLENQRTVRINLSKGE